LLRIFGVSIGGVRVPWIAYHHLNLLQEQDSPELLKDPEEDLERPLAQIQ
jgi:hypothetical protein